jgi:DNA invertase Pin-like site-specific DNA recombinase
MLIGYARVSKIDQNLNLQIDALKRVGCSKIFTDQVSGSIKSRPQLEQALDFLRSRDILVVWRLDRLGRSLRHLIELVAELQAKEIGFRSITEAMDTTTSGGKLIFHIFGALAEFERNVIQERTRAGLEAARARGRKGGRKPKLTEKQQQVAVKLYHEKAHTVEEICRIMGISKPTLYSYINKAEGGSEKRDATARTADQENPIPLGD